MIKLKTAKQEKFAHCIANGMTQADAYRAAFNATKMKPETIWSRASELMADSKVSARVSELKAEITKELISDEIVSRKQLLDELEEARILASTSERPQAGAMVQATMGKAKLLGLDVQKVDHLSSDGSMTPSNSQSIKEAIFEALKNKK